MKRLDPFVHTLFLAVCFTVVFPANSQDTQPVIQNAILEGIQFSEEEGSSENEFTVYCYFIFRDTPSRYFYDLRSQDKKLIFEFNDTEIGSSPIPSKAQPPITGFDIEQKRIDANAEIKGLTPEWHDMVKVTFNLSHIPRLTVNDEYNVVTFSYPWTKDESKLDDYIQQPEKGPGKWIIISTASGGAIGLGAFLAWKFFGNPDDDEPTELSIDDLPVHTTEQTQ